MTMTKTETDNSEANIESTVFSKKVITICLCTLIGCLIFISGISYYREHGQKSITIFTGNEFLEIKTDKKIVADILAEAGITIDENIQKVYPDLDQEIEADYIRVEDGVRVVLYADGEKKEIVAWGQTVEQFLQQQHIILEGDVVNLPLNSILVDGDEVHVTRVKTKLVHEEVSIPTNTTYKNNSSIAIGKEKVHTEPKDGVKMITYEVTYNDGVEVERKKVAEETVIEPVTGVVYRGTQAMVSRSGDGSRSKPSSNSNKTTYEGLASFYGGNLHGNKTASGAIFDKNAYTAAHRTLPFGTKVKVTYLSTGKSVVVTINDRGPFNDKIIDLSEAAAKQIGLYSAGIGRVKLEVLN